MDGGERRLFRYRLPAGPVAGAAVQIGHVAVEIALELSGELDVVAVTAARDATRDGALGALRAMAKGLMIRGLGSTAPRISASKGHRFTQRRQDFLSPDTVLFAGDCAVDFTERAEGATVAVSGNVGYSLAVRAAGRPGSDGWFTTELGAIGMVLLVGAPVGPGGLVAR